MNEGFFSTQKRALHSLSLEILLLLEGFISYFIHFDKIPYFITSFIKKEEKLK